MTNAVTRILLVPFIASLFQLAISAQSKTTISGTAATLGGCSPSSIGSDIKNEENCTFITKIYKTTRIYQKSQSVTIELTQPQLDYIVDEVTKRVLEGLREPFIEFLNAHAANSSEDITKASLPISTPDASVASVQRTVENAPSAQFADQQVLPREVSSPITSSLLANPVLPTAYSWVASPALTTAIPPAADLALPTTSSLFANPGGSNEQTIHLDLETESRVRIDAEGLRSSIVGMLSDVNSPYRSGPTDGAVGLLRLDSNGSVEITTTLTSLSETSIQFSGTNGFPSTQESALIGGSGDFSSPFAHLQVGPDGGVKFDDISLRGQAAPNFAGAILPITSTSVPENAAAWAVPLAQPTPINWSINPGDTTSPFPITSMQQVCAPGAKIQISNDGLVVACNQSSTGDWIQNLNSQATDWKNGPPDEVPSN